METPRVTVERIIDLPIRSPSEGANMRVILGFGGYDLSIRAIDMEVTDNEIIVYAGNRIIYKRHCEKELTDSDKRVAFADAIFSVSPKFRPTLSDRFALKEGQIPNKMTFYRN